MKLVATLILSVSVLSAQAQDITKYFDSQSFQIGSCMLILNQDKQISSKNLSSWNAVAKQMKSDPQSARIYQSLWNDLNNRNARSMFSTSVQSCARLGYKVL
jgi:hypothetical protein